MEPKPSQPLELSPAPPKQSMEEEIVYSQEFLNLGHQGYICFLVSLHQPAAWKCVFQFTGERLRVVQQRSKWNWAGLGSNLGILEGNPCEDKQGIVYEKLEANKSGKTFGLKNHTFYRRGGVGDGKKYLATGMAARLDQITEEKFRCSGSFL
ncbi:hypothetical protein AgCh_004172 [Apium graveolens]